MAHKLRLIVEDHTEGFSLLGLSDVSIYDVDIDILNPLLQIKVPGSKRYASIPFIPKKINVAFDSVDLGITRQVSVLPDGLYQISYSVSPNDEVNALVNHYRIENLKNDILSKLNKDFTGEDKWNLEGYNKLLLTAYLYMTAVPYYTGIGDFNAACQFYNKAYSLI